MNIDLSKLFLLKLSLEGYFVLECLYNKEHEVLRSYVNLIHPIPTKVFDDLVKQEWINTSKDDHEKYTVNNISITDKFKDEFIDKANNGITFDDVFDELKKAYPSEAGNSGRKLKANLLRCRALYKNTVCKGDIINFDMHKMILNCLLFEIKARTVKGNLDYFQMLQTWLGQRSWEVYSEDVMEALKSGMKVDSDITSGFTEDI